MIKNPKCKFQFFQISPDIQLNGRYDLIFSNACIQWTPEHKRLISKLFSALTDDGILAVQVPETRNMPMYKVLSTLQANAKWAASLSEIRNFYTLEMEEYYEILSQLSPDFSIWETNYIHRINGIDGLIEWYRGSGLCPYLAALTESQSSEFIQDIKERLREFYPLRSDGSLLMRFPRLFFTLVRHNKNGGKE